VIKINQPGGSKYVARGESKKVVIDRHPCTLSDTILESLLSNILNEVS